MNKVVKWLLLITAALFVLCFLAILIVPRFVNLEDYRPQIESKVSEVTGRPFTLGGDLELSLFPWAGIALSDLRLGAPPRFKEKDLAKKMGLVSMLSVPMAVKDRVIGVINCYTSEPHQFTEMEKNLFTTVANQAAVAIFNTELMVKTKVIQEELESRKLVGKAKDVLMRRRKMSGEEAHRWIQKRSMDSRKSMREVAEAVLLSEEL